MNDLFGDPVVFNIGYEGRTQAELIRILKAQGVTVLVDLREKPRSRMRGLSRGPLSRALEAAEIAYHPMGQLLGGFTCVEGQWKLGCRALAKMVEKDKEVVAMMCMERSWRKCHRRHLVAILASEHGIASMNL